VVRNGYHQPREVTTAAGAKAALAEIWNVEDREHTAKAARAFVADYGTKWLKAAAKITDDLDVLLAFYDYPAEHWIHLRTTNPIESTFATVRLRQPVTKGPGSRAAGVAMAFKLIESAQARWRAVNAPHLLALVRAGARFENGKLVERPTNREVIAKPRDQGGHETGRHVGQRELSGQVRLLDVVGCMDGLRHAGWAGR